MVTSNDKSKYNATNERMKYKYRNHIQRAKGKDIKTVIEDLKHIRVFEKFMQFAGFQTFNNDVACKYVQDLFNNGKAVNFITSNLRAVKDFLNWLERQRGYRSKIIYDDIDYLNVSRNQRREAKAQNYQETYKFDQIIKTIHMMANKTEKDKRDRAMVSLQALCTLRVSELRTVKIRNMIEEDGIWFIDVNPKTMSVKFAKHREAVFIPLADDIINNVVSWRNHLIAKGFKKDDPLFPAIDNRFNQQNLLEQHISVNPIKSDTTIRDVFKRAFTDAGLDYINPHSFRKTLAKYAQHQSPVFLNAVRQNLGHSSIDTTLSSYGKLSFHDQRKAITNLFSVNTNLSINRLY